LKSVLPSVLLLMCAVCPAAVAAQDVPDRTTSTGDIKAGRQSVTFADSFEVLPQVIKTGQEVKVRADIGRATQGKVVSITGDQVAIARRQYPFPYFRPRKEQVFAKDVVRSIDVVDSSWNGAVLGAGAAIGFLAVSIELDCSPSCDDNFGRPGRWVLGSVMLVPLGTAAGGLIDSLLNRRVYEKEPQRPRITIVPVLGRNGVGVMAQVRFREGTLAGRVKRRLH
jgi:hypothetical protein